MKSKNLINKGSVLSLRRRRMQIILAGLFILIGLYVASGSGLLATFGSSSQLYSDVPPSHYAYEHVQRLGDEGVFDGTECSSSGQFCITELVDRETTAVWIIKTITDDTPSGVSNSRFSDVSVGDWKAKYIEELAERGITSGCGNDGNGGKKFCPDGDVPRKHMAIFIFRAFDLPAGSDAGFEDVEEWHLFRKHQCLGGGRDYDRLWRRHEILPG